MHLTPTRLLYLSASTLVLSGTASAGDPHEHEGEHYFREPFIADACAGGA